MPIEPNARSGVRQQCEDGGCHRLEAKTGQNRSRYRHRGAESCNPLQQRAEAEGDQQSLQPAVLRQPGQGALDHVEIAAGDSQVVEEDCVEDDPADGPKTECHALCGRPDSDVKRHAPHQPTEDKGREHRGNRADPGRQAKDREHDEQDIER